MWTLTLSSHNIEQTSLILLSFLFSVRTYVSDLAMFFFRYNIQYVQRSNKASTTWINGSDYTYEYLPVLYVLYSRLEIDQLSKTLDNHPSAINRNFKIRKHIQDKISNKIVYFPNFKIPIYCWGVIVQRFRQQLFLIW